MEGLKAIPYLALIITIAGVVLGATVIVLDKFGNTITKCENASFTYNVTDDVCLNNTLVDAAISIGEKHNFTSEYATVYYGITSEGDVAEQLPTVAIIGVMVVIISIIAGVFVYLRYFA